MAAQEPLANHEKRCAQKRTVLSVLPSEWLCVWNGMDVVDWVHMGSTTRVEEIPGKKPTWGLAFLLSQEFGTASRSTTPLPACYLSLVSLPDG